MLDVEEPVDTALGLRYGEWAVRRPPGKNCVFVLPHFAVITRGLRAVEGGDEASVSRDKLTVL